MEKDILKFLTYDNIKNYLTVNFFKIIIALILLIFFNKISNLIYNIIKKFNSKIFKEKVVETFFNSISKIFIKIILAVIILQTIGIDFSGIFALVGGLGLILGFAFKETINNVCGGLILLTFKPFKAGDLIEFNGKIGTVKKIEIFYTTMVTLQNEVIIIPNGNLINDEIRNININEFRRLDIKVGVSYKEDIQKVKNLILSIIDAKKDQYFDYSMADPIVRLTNLGASSLDFDIKVYIKHGKYEDARYYLLETIKEKFDENNIDIPYNILDVRLSK